MAELACIFKPINPGWEGTVHGRVYGLGAGSAGALTMLVTSTFSPASSAAGYKPPGITAWGNVGLGWRSQGVWPGSRGCCSREQDPYPAFLLAQEHEQASEKKGTAQQDRLRRTPPECSRARAQAFPSVWRHEPEFLRLKRELGTG